MPAVFSLRLELTCDKQKCVIAGCGPNHCEFDGRDVPGTPTRNKFRRAAYNAGWRNVGGRWFCVSCAKSLPPKVAKRKSSR